MYVYIYIHTNIHKYTYINKPECGGAVKGRFALVVHQVDLYEGAIYAILRRNETPIKALKGLNCGAIKAVLRGYKGAIKTLLRGSRVSAFVVHQVHLAAS